MKRQEKECKQMKGISERTALKYLHALKIFCLFLKKDLDKATVADITAFVFALKQDAIRKKNGQPFSQKTKRDMVVAIERFYEWLFYKTGKSLDL